MRAHASRRAAHQIRDQEARLCAAAGSFWSCAVIRPRVHQLPPLVEHVTAPIGGLNFIRDRMREREFAHLRRICGLLSCPIAKCRAELRAQLLSARMRASTRRKRLGGLAGRRARLRAAESSRISIARSQSGTRCTRPPFMRAARNGPHASCRDRFQTISPPTLRPTAQR